MSQSLSLMVPPEILTRIAMFLPLWVEDTSLAPSRLLRFEPKTLLVCTLVSRFWRQVFLPVLWHRFDSHGMASVPKEMLVLSSPHFRVMRIVGKDTIPFQSANLVNLTFTTRSTGLLQDFIEQALERERARSAPSGAWITEGSITKNTAAALERQRQLVRSNPYLQLLAWHGPSPPQSTLDANDFTGMKCIQVLRLTNWSCSPEEMVKLLKIVAGTLQELKLDSIGDLLPQEHEQADAFTERLSALFTPQPSDDGTLDSHNNNNLNSNNGPLVLGRLEILVWIDKSPIDLFLAELSKCCPRLRSLDITLDINDTPRLADNLRVHCPDLKELRITPAASLCRVSPLIRYCSTAGLRKLTVEGCSSDGLIAALSPHVGTVVDMRLGLKDVSVEVSDYIRLVAECPNLESFSLSEKISPRGTVNLDTLTSENGWKHGGHRWKCQRLRSLELNSTAFSNLNGRRQEDWDLLREISDTKAVMGWYRPRKRSMRVFLYRRARSINHTLLRQMFELLQGLDHLESLVLDTVLYRPSTALVQLD